MIQAGINVLGQFTAADSLAEVPLETLKNLVARYPYHGAWQLLLAARLAASASEKAQQQRDKAALYFTNPFWFNWCLQALQGVETDTVINLPARKETIDATQANSEMTAEAAENEGATDIESGEQSATEPEHEIPGADDTAEGSNLAHLSRMIEQQLKDFQQPVDATQELPIKSHPFFTIDYFASQGIRSDAQQTGKDALTGKVKKFTEWLKEMKAINPKPVDLGTDPETEKLIETIAETSNKTKEIVTEAMADVLKKQGKTEKAIHLYQKLSFLNPSKSTYFAAKIEELKG